MVRRVAGDIVGDFDKFRNYVFGQYILEKR
jgi:hypothetical protein